ncbi:MAG: cyanophycinase [Bacteroidetes bacterium RIFOXYA12_FULL_35_11]|nr:MAG: cyanophycinase [Bacteroidetes bacterium GWF2_35_48]OFY76273.1 MAG: cyanophycinase [Bacteroidetes bacterium RIFOXYA12_FULL_35_11]HBX52683.1 cyanophycinase [Bacteroidales bacterium]
MEHKRSFLILIGGAEDKTGNKEVLKKVMEISGAKTITIVPSASSYPDEVFRGYEHAFRDLGASNIFNLDIRYADEAGREEFAAMIDKSELIFFGGGDQVKLVEIFSGTPLLEKIKERFYNGTLCLAGTSAGAAAASNPMLYDGDYKGFHKGSVNSSNGFGFLEDITVDTHFLNRERISRLVQYLSAGNSSKGIGLDEDTAIVISPDLQFEVIGSGMVTLINTDRVTFSNYKEVEQTQMYSVNNLRMSFFAAGTVFSLKRWVVLKNAEIKKKDSGESSVNYFPSSFVYNN